MSSLQENNNLRYSEKPDLPLRLRSQSNQKSGSLLPSIGNPSSTTSIKPTTRIPLSTPLFFRPSVQNSEASNIFQSQIERSYPSSSPDRPILFPNVSSFSAGSLLRPFPLSHHSPIFSGASINSNMSEISSTAPYDVHNEESPVERFYTSVLQKAIQQGTDMAKAAVSALEKFDGTSESGSHVQKLLRDAKTLTTFQGSDTRTIAILGDSGEGKSSLINSLLHCPGLAKTSDWGSACTSVVTEYRQRKQGQITPILIEIEYLTQAQIEEQVCDLLWSYRLGFVPDFTNDTVPDKKFNRTQRESETAWSALDAAFGHQKEFDHEFLLDESDGALEAVASKLIQWTREIVWPAGKFHNGTWTSTAETAEECCDKTNEFMQDRLWPFTKIIRVYLDAVVLKNGIVLTDLPDLQDTNLARAQATQEYIMKSDYVFVVSRISRARTDRSLKDSINTVLPQHISLEDDFATRNFHLAIVCTMAEGIDEESALKEFCGPGKRVEESVIKSLDQEIESAKKVENHFKEKELKQKRKQLLINARNEHVTEILKKEHAPKMKGKKLDVFCVSNKTYKKFSDQGNAAMVRASGIPELRRFCRSIVAEDRLLEAKNFLRSNLSSLLNSIDLWTESAPATVPENDSTQSLTQFFQEVETKASDDIFSTEQTMRDTFEEFIASFLYNSKLRADWKQAASIKSQDWAKWSPSKYDTWCENNGNPSAQGPGSVNWNGELNWKMRTDLGFQWEMFEEEIPQILTFLLNRLKMELEKLGSYLCGFNSKLVKATALRTQDFEYKYSLIQKEFERDIAFIRSRASEPNELSYMTHEMRSTYRAACKIRGTEKAARQRALIQGKINGVTIFDNISRRLTSDMEGKFEGLCNQVQKTAYETLDRIQEDLSMIMPDGQGHNTKAEEQFKEQLAAEVQKLKATHLEVQFSILRF